MEYSKKLHEKLYRTMLRIRYCEESFVEPILNKEIKCPVHLYSGEEAIATGVCAALEKTDYIFGTHRSHGHYLAKGGNMVSLIAEIYGREDGCSRGRGGSMHLIDPELGIMGAAPIVAGTISLAVGAALASFIRKDNRVTVSFFGDGATGEGVLYESLNFAALKKLPIVFVCENNLYATHMPILECRSKNNIYEIAKPFGIETDVIDGNDVLMVYDAGRKAVDKCRRGDGPVFLEFRTYRLRGHVGPDDNIQGTHKDIRSDEEVELWKKKDPIMKYEKFLLDKRIFSANHLQEIRAEIEQEVQNNFKIALKSPCPQKGELFRYVFKN